MGNWFSSHHAEDRYKPSGGTDQPDGRTPVVEKPVCVEDIVDLESINVNKEVTDLANYCLPLIETKFYGQTTADGHTDESSICEVLNLGLYLQLLDKFLRQHEKVTDLTGEEEEFLHLLKLIALKRCGEKEASDKCYKKLVTHSKRFIQIYQKRGVHSEILNHKSYWGSRQQMLSGKVIADWVEEDNGSLDPIFGVLLQPTSGRVGPGDTGWFHNVLFDDEGHMAYHSAVHDAFGYLLNFHKTGPGYDYLKDSYFSKENPLAGQISGIAFWSNVLEKVGDTKLVKLCC